METMAEYLAELVKAGLEDRKAGVSARGSLCKGDCKDFRGDHMDYLLLELC